MKLDLFSRSDAVSALGIEEKIFVVISIIGILLSFFGGVMNMVLGLSALMTAGAFGMAVVIFLVLRLTVKKSCYHFSTLMVLAILTLGLYPSVWFTTAGSHGTTPYFYMFNFMIIGVLLNKSRVVPMFLLNVATFYLLMSIEFLHPEWVIGYTSETMRRIDFAIFFMIMCVAAFVLAYRIMREYNKKINSLDQAHKELEVLSTTDMLSGLFNRRFVMNVLENEIHKKTEDGLCLIMIDIDHFKNINDTYGHSVGDEAIIKVSKAIRNNIRKSDVLGRIGGEEFLVILKDTNAQQAMKVAEKLRIEVERIDWTVIRDVVSISCGVYGINEVDTLNGALEKVDNCLYHAKETGRNRVVEFSNFVKA